MIRDIDLIAMCEQPLEEGWGYIFGATGQVWTEKDQKNTTNEQAKAYGAQWIGKRVVDCSGLFYWAFRQLGGYIYHGSNTIWNQYVRPETRGKLTKGKREDGKRIRPGSAVFLTERKADGSLSRHHIGLYIGGNLCVEAKGTKSGVVSSALSHWDEVAELKDVSYDVEVIQMTLRRGCSGPEVKELQTDLIALGYDIVGTADGVFGTRTEQGVKAFQLDNGLTADGVVGEKTWAALRHAVGAPEMPGDEGETAVEDTEIIAAAKAAYEALRAVFERR